MNLNKLLALLLLSQCFVLSGCSSDEELLDVINPIELNYYSVAFDEDVYRTDQVVIKNGNGGYKISYPKKVFLSEPIDPSEPRLETWNEYDFPNDKMHVYISGDTIYFEDEISLKDCFFAYFLITDSKNQKELILAWTLYFGKGPRLDKEIEERIKNDPDYWQD